MEVAVRLHGALGFEYGAHAHKLKAVKYKYGKRLKEIAGELKLNPHFRQCLTMLVLRKRLDEFFQRWLRLSL